MQQHHSQPVPERSLAALAVLHVGTFLWTIDTHALDADETLHRMLGLDDGPRLRAIADLLARVDDADRYRLAQALERCAADGAELHEEVRIRHPDGAARWLEVRGRATRPSDGRPTHLVGACLDITDRRDRDEHDADFLAVVTHELRTPLNAIAGYASLMLEGIPSPVTEPQSEYLRRIEKSYHHLINVIDAVLIQAKARAGKIEYRLTDVTVGQILDRIEPLTAPQRAEKRLAYDCRGCDRAMALEADADKVVQIVLNLLSNAVKFTPAQGRITVSTRTRPARRGALLVRDTGIGLTPEQMRLVFEPYTQFDATAGERPGTGLGLSISRELARGMSGEITVESEPGKGSVFTLTLPLASAAAAA